MVYLQLLRLLFLNQIQLNILNQKFLTTDEESRYDRGPLYFDITKLESNIIVNIDSEDYGCICVSSAGGIRLNTLLELEKEDIKNKDNIYYIELNGLKGGHSGIDINKGAANATKVLNEILRHLNIQYDLNIVEFVSGGKDNTIPREAIAVIATDATYEQLKKSTICFLCTLNHQYL